MPRIFPTVQVIRKIGNDIRVIHVHFVKSLINRRSWTRPQASKITRPKAGDAESLPVTVLFMSGEFSEANDKPIATAGRFFRVLQSPASSSQELPMH